tara:strand:- start:844 stop:1899 length:1056 start_codon:yes stop_codon:yes gene_type:complete
MKEFKTFFEDNELGDIDIYAQSPGSKPTPLGQVDEPGLNTISKFIYKVNERGDELIKKLVTTSKFDTKDYHRAFKSVLEEFDINWTTFADHVENRFTTGVQLDKLFRGRKNQFNLKEQLQPTLNSWLNTPEESGDAFFEEMFSLKHSIGTTSVGDGEFLLGIVGNGQKGEVGDVDVITVKGKSLELGAQRKIIGASTRTKGAKGAAIRILKSIEAIGKKPVGVESDVEWTEVMEVIKSNFSILTPDEIQYIGEQLLTYAPEPKRRGQKWSPAIIIGSVVLYDYIKGHQDDYIVIVNYSSSEENLNKKLDKYWCRYANIKNMTLEQTINLSIDQNTWYVFEISADGVRIKLG